MANRRVLDPISLCERCSNGQVMRDQWGRARYVCHRGVRPLELARIMECSAYEFRYVAPPYQMEKIDEWAVYIS